MKTNANNVTAESYTKPEFLSGEQFHKQYDAKRDAGVLVIVVRDTGESKFRPSKINSKGKLTQAAFDVVQFGAWTPELLNGLAFEQGRHAGQPVSIKLSISTTPTLSQCPADVQREALNAIVSNTENSDTIRKAASATLAKLAPLPVTETAAVQ